jgi:hypothetical protein
LEVWIRGGDAVGDQPGTIAKGLCAQSHEVIGKDEKQC